MKKTIKNFPHIDDLNDMWIGLTREEKNYLRENTTLLEFKKNQAIYMEGEKPSHFFCLITGKVKICKAGVGYRSQIMRMVAPNETFAYRAFYADEEYITSAIAIETSYIYSAPINVLKNLILNNNKLAINFIKELSVELGKSDAKVISLTQKHVRGRLADTLLHLRDTYGIEEDTGVLKACLSREDLACFASMTTSNAIRTLSNFVAENIIEIRGRMIRIIDESQLRKMSRLG